MSKRTLVTRSLALTAVAGFSTMAFAPAAFAEHDGIGHGDASASTGSGALFELLDTGICETDGGAATGRCGDGLSLNAQINAFSQNASGNRADGTSSADASVAPIDIANFASLDLTGVIDGLEAVNTGTVLDSVLGPLGAAIQTIVAPIRAQVIDAIDDALQDALAQLHGALPLTAEVGAVEAQCTARPSSASGNGTVAGVDVILSLGGQQIRVPLVADTEPNSPLVASFPRQAVADVVAGVKDTFSQSLGGALTPLNALLDQLVTPVSDQLFDALEPTLLSALDDGLEPLVHGTVNKQTTTGAGQIEVTSLDLTLFEAAGANAQNLELGRVACGPNRAGTPHTPDDDNDTPAGPAAPAGPAVPTSVTSGARGQENVARLALGATGTLLVMAGAGSLMRRRFAELG